MIPALATDTVTPDLARATGYALLWGLEGVALRTVGSSRVPFVNEAVVRHRLGEDDLPLVAVDPGLFEGSAASRAVWLNDVAAFEETAAFCHRLGCGTVRVGALGEGGETDERVDALRRLGDVAAAAGLRLAVRNEVGTAIATGTDLAGLLAAVGHPAVAADWRPAEALQAGESPSDGLDAVLAAGDVACVAVADGTHGPDGWAAAAVGEGAVGWDFQLARLVRAGFDGPLVVEVAARPAGPAGLASATALLRLVRQAVRGAGHGAG